ncbi:MAG: hypothetical protein EOP36_07405 [Rubrivivax sp.]|nr:MAG: hypothetical protein EOP36_07405 [Rubrivivax sp.]
MRQLQTEEVKAVSGAGLLLSTVKVGAEAGTALVNGFVQAGTIVAKPLASTVVSVLKFLI